jgi:ssDNA-binding Zn-finger/Zn-ribbon topoisomerase 1
MILYLERQCSQCDTPLGLRLVARMLGCDGNRTRSYSGLCPVCGSLESEEQKEADNAQPK